MRTSNKIQLASAAALLATSSLTGISSGAVTVTTGNNATALANAIVGTGVTIVGTPTLFSRSALQQGTFVSSPSTIVGFDSGVILSTGRADNAVGPNSDDGVLFGTQWNTTVDDSNTIPAVQRAFNPSPIVHRDANMLSFNFTVPANSGGLTVQYVFASEEYLEFVNTGFNDSFAFVVDGQNIALLPNGTPVTIDTVNSTTNSGFYRNNTPIPGTIDIEYDGLTTVLTANVFAALNPNLSTHSMTFSIADVGDAGWDSAVFIRADSFQVPEPTTLGLLAAAGAASLRRKR